MRALEAEAREQPLVAVGRVMSDTRTVREPIDIPDPAATESQRESARQRSPRVYVAEVSVLPRELRERLADRVPFGLPQPAEVFASADGTRRYLLRLADGRTVETVLMPEGERFTFCISSQVGCPVNCGFCLTARMGLERNLTAGEIVGQVRHCHERSLELVDAGPELRELELLVGEPRRDRAIELFAGVGKCHCHVAEHIGVLRTLTWKKCGYFHGVFSL